jgi:hypothetical protein
MPLRLVPHCGRLPTSENSHSANPGEPSHLTDRLDDPIANCRTSGLVIFVSCRAEERVTTEQATKRNAALTGRFALPPCWSLLTGLTRGMSRARKLERGTSGGWKASVPCLCSAGSAIVLGACPWLCCLGTACVYGNPRRSGNPAVAFGLLLRLDSQDLATPDGSAEVRHINHTIPIDEDRRRPGEIVDHNSACSVLCHSDHTARPT